MEVLKGEGGEKNLKDECTSRVHTSLKEGKGIKKSNKKKTRRKMGTQISVPFCLFTVLQ